MQVAYILIEACKNVTMFEFFTNYPFDKKYDDPIKFDKYLKIPIQH